MDLPSLQVTPAVFCCVQLKFGNTSLLQLCMLVSHPGQAKLLQITGPFVSPKCASRYVKGSILSKKCNMHFSFC